MIEIRRALAGDVPAMSLVLVASITELCGLDHQNDPAAIASWTANKTTDSVARWVADPGLVMLVAIHEREIAAVGCLTAPDQIGLNYVAPAHRFKGISKALLAAMETLMRQTGVTEGHLTSTATALEFYRTHGWQDVAGPLSRRPAAGYPMRKRL